MRELENEAKRLVAVTPEGSPLTVDRLSQKVANPGRDERSSSAPVSLAEQEKELVELHLRRAGGNRTHAAKSLGISREGLRKKMIRLGLS